MVHKGHEEQGVDNIEGGEKAQILLGATGTGKTYTMSQVIAQVNKPTLVIAHNKTLAGQLYGEFKEFFPDNAVEYFVSYYDYYQPEAYVPSSDTYIEKDSSVNDEIDKLRHSATSALLERNDVIVVASVSCIYGLGSPKEYADSVVSLRPGQEISRDQLLNDLVDIQFERNDIDFQRGRFRVRGAGPLRAKPSGFAAWTCTRGHEISGIAPCLDLPHGPLAAWRCGAVCGKLDGGQAVKRNRKRGKEHGKL